MEINLKTLEDLKTECFRLLREKKASEAKTRLQSSHLQLKGASEKGVRMALLGICDTLLSTKNNSSSLLDEEERQDKFVKIFERKKKEIWCDEFDKAYFQTWVEFIGSLRSHAPKAKVHVQDPSK